MRRAVWRCIRGGAHGGFRAYTECIVHGIVAASSIASRIAGDITAAAPGRWCARRQRGGVQQAGKKCQRTFDIGSFRIIVGIIGLGQRGAVEFGRAGGIQRRHIESGRGCRLGLRRQQRVERLAHALASMIARGTTPLGPGFSALMDLAVWFHHPPDVSDWLLYEQHSPSGIGGRGLAQGTMFNRTGQLVCTMTLECYFGGKSSG